ncbi:MAG: ATP-binding protein [Chitinophagales bacterium]|nr:ATP-binding protein [Chitinophagales bacterium]
MYYLLNENEVKLYNRTYTLQNESDKFYYLGTISKINLLIGANNSGKSSFLRNLLRINDFISINKTDILHSLSQLADLLKNLDAISSNNLSISIRRIYENKGPIVSLNLQLSDSFSHSLNSIDQLSNNFTINGTYFSNMLSLTTKKETKDIPSIQKSLYQNYHEINLAYELLIPINSDFSSRLHRDRLVNISGSGHNHILNFIAPLLPILKNIAENSTETITPISKLYIPVLRSLNTLYDNNRLEAAPHKINYDILEQSANINYDLNSSNVETFTGQSLYNDILKIRNSSKSTRVQFEEFEKFLSETFFQGKALDIIANYDSGLHDHLSLFLDGVENDIFKFGDGIQTLIMLLYPIFIAKKGSFVFIEEPEINLHPGFQRIFLDTISNNSFLRDKNLTYFITSHSNHFIDASLTISSNISIFSFQERVIKDGLINSISSTTSKDPITLELLGVKSSSVLLANCSLWLEGKSDLLYIRSFINAYLVENNIDNNELKEDIHYSFFIYGGSLMSNYLFGEMDELSDIEVEKINSRYLSSSIMLISDRDKGKTSKHVKHLQSQNSNFVYHPLNVIEIENLLSPIELSRHLPGISEKLNKIDFNQIILKQGEYKRKHLPIYLSEILKPKTDLNWLSSGNTMKTSYKMKLSKSYFLNSNWNEMSNDAKKLTEKIIEFIRKSN